MSEAFKNAEYSSVKGVKNILFGGEEAYLTTKVTGPEKIIVQTMPIHAIAQSF